MSKKEDTSKITQKNSIPGDRYLRLETVMLESKFNTDLSFFVFFLLIPKY